MNINRKTARALRESHGTPNPIPVFLWENVGHDIGVKAKRGTEKTSQK